MYLLMFAVLATFPIYAVASCFGQFDKTPTRDYANKIGMICVHNDENSENEIGRGSFFIEIGQNEWITDHIKILGIKRKIIYFIFGYGTDFKPKKNGDQKLKKFTKMLKDWRLENETVVCGFDLMHTSYQNGFKLVVNYRKVVKKRVPFAAEIIGNVVKQMYERKVFDSFQNVQLIGFSLGCHVAGFVGRHIKEKLQKDIPRIFALDPPKTFIRSKTKQLKITDAKYVQIILTSKVALKTIEAHCRIIINDGINQPTCDGLNFVQKTICNHNYLFWLYNWIARGEYELFAQKDPKANDNDKNVPDEMLVGHLNPENVCGIFYANVTHASEEEEIVGDSDINAVDPSYIIDSNELKEIEED